MKTLWLIAAFVVASCSWCATPAIAGIEAELTLAEKAGKVEGVRLLWAEVRLTGIADCPTSGSVTIVFTSPDEDRFVSSEFEAPWRSCSRYAGDDGKRGTARTRAYRTVKTGKRIARGIWRVAVKAGETVLATGEYEVR